MSSRILHHLAMPGESAEYRTARNKLLTEEIALRRQIESIARLNSFKLKPLRAKDHHDNQDDQDTNGFKDCFAKDGRQGGNAGVLFVRSAIRTESCQSAQP